jgi:hypothetical protein
MSTPFFDSWEAEQRYYAQNPRGSASGRPDRPVPPLRLLEFLKAEVQDLVDTNPDLAHWELRHLIKAQFPKVEAATVTAALQAAQKRKEAPLTGYAPGDELHDQQVAWLLQDFIPAADMTMLVATAKAGKTRFYLGLLAALHSAERQFLGRELPAAPPVLLIGTDMPRSVWRQYLQSSGLSESGRVPDFIHRMYTLDRPLLLNAEGFASIKADCEAHPGSWVILDSFRSCSRNLGIDENSAEAADLLYQLSSVVTETGGTPLICHHAPKGIIRDGSVGVAAVRGSSAIGGVPSQVISLHHLTKQLNGYAVAQKDDPRRRCFVEGRHSEPLDLLLQMDEGMQWQLLGDFGDYERDCAAEREQQRLTEGQEKLLALIKSQSRTIEQAAEQLGVDARTIRRQSKSLADRGFLERRPAGKTFTLCLPSADQSVDPDGADAPTQPPSDDMGNGRFQLRLVE